MNKPKIILIVCLLLIANQTFAKPTGPVMRLFPTTVLADINETSEVAAEMENDLQDVISKLDLQQRLYNESQCNNSDEDPGCKQISKQLGASYLEMLAIMTERLPDMEQAVNSTRSSLEKRLRSELGQKSTPSSLQDTLLGKSSATKVAQSVALRGRSGVRLSSRFKEYYQLVATRQKNSAQSLAVIAADIYLDMDEASRLIAATQEEISRATLMEQLNQSFGQITPEMSEVVSGVKSILFGEAMAESPIASAPALVSDTPYVSPLEM